MMIHEFSRRCGGALLLLVGACTFEHRAPVHSAELPPLSSPVLHSSRIWLEISDNVGENACVAPAEARLLCFERQRSELVKALDQSLWTSFPGVEHGTGPHAPGDYVLYVELGLEALPPDEANPGWSAGARGSWRVERDGHTLAGAHVASRSRGDFSYGAPLGLGAGEVISAVAVCIGMSLSTLPETRVVQALPLPAVAVAPLDLASDPKPAAELNTPPKL